MIGLFVHLLPGIRLMHSLLGEVAARAGLFRKRSGGEGTLAGVLGGRLLRSQRYHDTDFVNDSP